MQRKLQLAAAVLGTCAASGLAPAAAGAADRGDFVLDLGTGQPEANATVKIDIVLRHPDDPNAKPSPLRAAQLRLPSGTRIDTSNIPRCDATDEELRARGTSACPAESRVGGGTLIAMTGFGPPADPGRYDMNAYNGGTELIETVSRPGTSAVVAVDRVGISGDTLNPRPPKTPGGPPEGETAVKEVHLVFDRPGFVTTPGCTTGTWSYGSTFEFADGAVDVESRTLPCDRARSTAPALAFASKPARARVGERTTFRFRVRSADAGCMSGAKVRFAGRRARTDSRGRATITTTLRSAGAYRLSASKRGCRAARGSVVAVR